jgi:thiamine biosynthesis lipoprotein
LASCNSLRPTKPIQFAGEAQGTYYAIIYYDEQQRNFQPEIDSLLKAFDQSVSLWVPESIISMVNNNEEGVILDDYFIDNLKISLDVAEQTDGAFDPTVGTLVRAWGFGFDETRQADQERIDSILVFTGYEKVKLVQNRFVKEDSRTTIDFNAVAQGYAVDLLGQFLDAKGIRNYLVDIGGEVKARGNKSDGSFWKVGIEKPAKEKEDPRDLKAVVDLEDLSIATSGNYRKFYEEDGMRYSHTIDPKTGYPVQHSLLSVSVIAETTAIADAYATAFMVMGLEKSKSFLAEHGGFDAFFIFSDTSGNFQTYATEGFKEKVSRSFE